MRSLCFWFVYFTLDAVYKVKAGLIMVLSKTVKPIVQAITQIVLYENVAIWKRGPRNQTRKSPDLFGNLVFRFSMNTVKKPVMFCTFKCNYFFPYLVDKIYLRDKESSYKFLGLCI